MHALPVAQVSVSVEGVPWLWWTFVAVMIVLQLVILIVIAGRPSAIAVICVTLPFLAGVCALTTTWLVLDYLHAHPKSEDSLVPLLYVSDGICGVIALTCVVLCLLKPAAA